MNNLLRDFRHGVRVILKNRGVSAVAVVALALGIGVTATMYSIVYGAMLKGLPFEGGDRVYAINRTDITDEGSTWSVPIHDYLDWRAQQTVFEDIGGYYTGTVNVAGTEVRYATKGRSFPPAPSKFSTPARRSGAASTTAKTSPTPSPWCCSATTCGATATAAIRRSSAIRSAPTASK